MKRIVGVIPSRFASTRLLGKPLALIAGKTLIRRVWEQASKAKRLDSLVVATDDKRVFNHVTSFGGKAVMTSLSCKSGTDRLSEVARKHELGAFAFVNIQGDEPLISPDLIDRIALSLRNGEAKMVTAAFALKDDEELGNPNAVKVVADKYGNAVYFSRSPIPYRRVAGKAKLLKHIGIYGYTRSSLLKYSSLAQTPLELCEQLEQLRAVENGYKIRLVMSTKDSIGVDTAADIKKVERMLRK